MKTEVEMQRRLFGLQIAQKSKSEFFSATDIVKAGTKWRVAHDLPAFNLSAWLTNKNTKIYIQELELKFGKAIIKGRGRGKHTWVHPLLFIDLALAINPKLKIEVYEWLFDHLIRKRNESGTSYKTMCGNLYVRHTNKKNFPEYISKVANRIKHICKVEDWQQATEEQLTMRDSIQYDIALLSDVLNNNKEATRIAFKKSKNMIRKGKNNAYTAY